MQSFELFLMSMNESKKYEVVKIIDLFNSLLWTERYNSLGEFELVRPVLNDFQELVKPNSIIQLSRTKSAMFVEYSTIELGVEDAPKHIIKGRSLTSILTRRIIWDQTSVDGTIFDSVSKLINENIINPTDATGGEKRRIPNFKIIDNRETYPVLNSNVRMQFTCQTLYEAISKICELYNLGFKVELNYDSEFEFSMYSGVNRSYSQDVNPYVIFSPKFENLITSTWVSDAMLMKNFVKVFGAGEGENRKTAYFGYSEELSGIERIELPVDARDLSDKLDSYDVEIDADIYNDMLMKRGIEKLKENSLTETFDGQAETNITYKLNDDFFLGDLVQIENEFGVTATSRITEIVHAEDDSGIRIYPTFKSDSNIIQDSYKYMEKMIEEYEKQIKKGLEDAEDAEKRKEKEKEEAEKRARDEEKQRALAKEAEEKAKEEREKLDQMLKEQSELDAETQALILEKYDELYEPFRELITTQDSGETTRWSSLLADIWDTAFIKPQELFTQEKNKMLPEFENYFRKNILGVILTDVKMQNLVSKLKLEINKKADISKYNKLKAKYESLTNQIKSIDKLIEAENKKKKPNQTKLKEYRDRKSKLTKERTPIKADLDLLKPIITKLDSINKSIDDIIKLEPVENLSISNCVSKYNRLRSVVGSLESEKSLINQTTLKETLKSIDEETKEVEWYEILYNTLRDYILSSDSSNDQKYAILSSFLATTMYGVYTKKGTAYYYDNREILRDKINGVGRRAQIEFKNRCEKSIQQGKDNRKIVEDIFNDIKYNATVEYNESVLRPFILSLKNLAVQDVSTAKPVFIEHLRKSIIEVMSVGYKEKKVNSKTSIKLNTLSDKIIKDLIANKTFRNLMVFWDIDWNKILSEYLMK